MSSSSKIRSACIAATRWRILPDVAADGLARSRRRRIVAFAGSRDTTSRPTVSARTTRSSTSATGRSSASDPQALCVSCRLTRIIPDLTVPEHRDAWYRLEAAKRRLVYTLLSLQLPLVSKQDDPASGLAFDFLSDAPARAMPPILTGHADGVITVNIAEADDAERERRRTQLHEPYRTLLGHFRHESGHYYWDRLIRGRRADRRPFASCSATSGRTTRRRSEQHYENGPAADWYERFVSAYAGAHPWEDWAETWAHYLHMTDTLETAAACGLSIRPRRADEPLLRQAPVRGGLACRVLRSADRQLVSADLRAQQPQSRPRPARRLSVRALAAGHREAPVRPRDRGSSLERDAREQTVRETNRLRRAHGWHGRSTRTRIIPRQQRSAEPSERGHWTWRRKYSINDVTDVPWAR